MTFAQILFPVDFSERSIAAASHVEAIATQFGSKVTLMNVVDVMRACSVAVDFGVAYGYELDTVDVKNQIWSQLEEFAEDHLRNVCRGIYVEDGEPACVITRFAQQRGIDLIMMPSHGYGPFRSLLLGSVTAKVLHDADCPVWTSAHMETFEPESHLPYRDILCAIDLSRRSTGLIQWADRLAQSLSANLQLVHAVRPMEPWAETRINSQFEEDMREYAREQIAGFQKEAGTAAPVNVATGGVGEVVAEQARRHGTDLLMIGRGCLQQKVGRLRTHAYSIIRQAPCPVISV